MQYSDISSEDNKFGASRLPTTYNCGVFKTFNFIRYSALLWPLHIIVCYAFCSKYKKALVFGEYKANKQPIFSQL